MSSLYIPKTLISAWKLVCSLAGVLVLGYGVLVFITGVSLCSIKFHKLHAKTIS